MFDRPVPADEYGLKCPGGGRMAVVLAPFEVRGTTRHVAGLWPFGCGSGSPLVGIPMGQHQVTGAVVCADPINWFEAGLLSNPNLFVAAQPGLGKSTAVRRMVLGYSYQGITTLVLGDLKPDYADLVAALGGQVVQVGPGRHRINPLDAGPWRRALPKLGPEEARILRDDVVSRRRALLEALGGLTRGQSLTDRESTVLAAVCEYLTERERDVQPTLGDVIATIQQAPDEVRAATLDLGDHQHWYQKVEGLLETLNALQKGAFGRMFDGQTTVPMDLDAPAVTIDISSIGETDEKLTVAALITMWGHGFAQVELAHRLAEQGLAPKRRFFAVMDELWRALRAPGLVDRLDALTRLSRAKGTGLAYISHGLDDLEALPAEHDRAKARGIAQRCAMKLFGGLSLDQLDRIKASLFPLSRSEVAALSSWAQQDSGITTAAAERAVQQGSAGRGNFMIKTGAGTPGIPLKTVPTGPELALGNTDARFNMVGAAS